MHVTGFPDDHPLIRLHPFILTMHEIITVIFQETMHLTTASWLDDGSRARRPPIKITCTATITEQTLIFRRIQTAPQDDGDLRTSITPRASMYPSVQLIAREVHIKWAMF